MIIFIKYSCRYYYEDIGAQVVNVVVEAASVAIAVVVIVAIVRINGFYFKGQGPKFF